MAAAVLARISSSGWTSWTSKSSQSVGGVGSRLCTERQALRVLHGQARGRRRPSTVTRACRSRRSRRSSSPRAAWRRAGACCITWRMRCPTRRTPCCLPAIRPRERGDGSCSTAREVSRIHGAGRAGRARHRADRLHVGACRSPTRSCDGWRTSNARRGDVPRPRRACAHGRAARRVLNEGLGMDGQRRPHASRERI